MQPGGFIHWSQIRSASCPTAGNTATRRAAALDLMRDAPDRAVAVFRDQQRSVARNGHADRASPHFGIIDDKAGHEVLILAGRLAILHANADQLVAGAP